MIQKKKVNTFIKYGVIFTIIVFLLLVRFASVGHIPIRVLVTRLDELRIEILCTAKSELTCITDAEASRNINKCLESYFQTDSFLLSVVAIAHLPWTLF